jgi:hypothetical protein
MGATCDVSTIMRGVGPGWSCVHAGAWLLVVLVTCWKSNMWEHGWWGHQVPCWLMVQMGCCCMSLVDVQTRWCKCGPKKLH